MKELFMITCLRTYVLKKARLNTNCEAFIMSVNNKYLTDKQIQDAYIFMDGTFNKSTEFDHGLFSEWLILKPEMSI